MFNSISFLILLFGHVIIGFQNDEDELLNRTFDALNKSFDFVLSDYRHMNVDGILGITEAQAHLEEAISKATDPNTLKILTILFDKATKIYHLQSPHLPNFPYKYYVFNNYVLPYQLWKGKINFSYGKLNPNLKVDTGPYNVDDIVDYLNYIVRNTFSEEQSDSCLVEIAAASDNTEPHDCPISDTCVLCEIYADNTHELLFKVSRIWSNAHVCNLCTLALLLQIGRNRNCNFNYDKVNEMLEKECSYILWELRKNVQYGYIPNLDDLLYEQVHVCGIEGFGEFLEKEYLEHVLNNQQSHGGFGIKRLTKKQLSSHNRPKRESVRMKHGANSHTTGLAISVLALYTRVLIEKPFSNKAFYGEQ